MAHLTKYEKETILLTSEGDSTWDVFTYNRSLLRRLRTMTEQYPEYFRFKCSNENGVETYIVDKGRLSIRLTAPYSEKRRKVGRCIGGLSKLRETFF